MKDYKLIIWDWNGTLLDDISASLGSVNDMLLMRKMEPIDILHYKECIGVPIKVFYDQVFDMEKEDYNVIIKQYNEGYLCHLKNVSLSDGAGELLEKFAAEGKKQVIVSSSNSAQLIENVKKYGIMHYFDAVLGAADYYADSKIDRAFNYIMENKIDPESILVIGDLAHDAELADQLGADCILLSSGHEKPERLAGSGVKVIDSLRELIPEVQQNDGNDAEIRKENNTKV